jgi:four helix bundle protein
MEHFNFEDLKVYQKALDFIDSVYDATKDFPTEEKYNLTSQFRRASVSISLNVSEGTGASNKENIRYLGIAHRSAKECVTCSTVAYRRNYYNDAVNQKIRKEVAELAKMISGLIKYLENRN